MIGPGQQLNDSKRGRQAEEIGRVPPSVGRPLVFPGTPRDGFERAVKRLCFSPSASVAASASGSSREDSEQSGESENIMEEFLRGQQGATSAYSAGPPSETSLDEIGPDLLLHVLRLARPTAWDLCRFACVNKTWNKLTSSKTFWTKLRISSGSIRPGVESLATKCSHVQELHVDDPRCELFILHPIVLACAGSLQRVVVNCDKDGSSRNEAAISSILWIVSLHCKRVETVELLSKGKSGGFDYIENKVLWYLTSGFRSMRSFACLCKDSVTKQSLYLMVIAWRELACLRLNCGLLHKEDLLCLKKCTALRVLELAGGDLGALMAARGHTEGQEHEHLIDQRQEVIHPELEVLVLTNTRCASPAHLSALLASFPGLKRVLLNKQSWALGTPDEMPQLRRQFGALQRWLRKEMGVEVLMEE